VFMLFLNSNLSDLWKMYKTIMTIMKP
jgi:Kef-type K+ transport system membrane component KefB